MVYKHLTTAAAKKELIALLDAQDERILEIAAQALMKHGDSSAAPALTKAMERVQDDQIRRTSSVHYGKSGRMTNLLKQF